MECYLFPDSRLGEYILKEIVYFILFFIEILVESMLSSPEFENIIFPLVFELN
jgi:hypothetical protein